MQSEILEKRAKRLFFYCRKPRKNKIIVHIIGVGNSKE
jgi:hypothetical protein